MAFYVTDGTTARQQHSGVVFAEGKVTTGTSHVDIRYDLARTAPMTIENEVEVLNGAFENYSFQTLSSSPDRHHSRQQCCMFETYS